MQFGQYIRKHIFLKIYMLFIIDNVIIQRINLYWFINIFINIQYHINIFKIGSIPLLQITTEVCQIIKYKLYNLSHLSNF